MKDNSYWDMFLNDGCIPLRGFGCGHATDYGRTGITDAVLENCKMSTPHHITHLTSHIQVIQAVNVYKSLTGFVSTTLLSRLITKKIWTNPPLWEGFIRCAKSIAPASFGALLQLPKDQLRDVVEKQPSLKVPLRDYVTKKAGIKARSAGFLDIFGDEPPTKAPTPPLPPEPALATSPA
jgi:hypothetical protein